MVVAAKNSGNKCETKWMTKQHIKIALESKGVDNSVMTKILSKIALFLALSMTTQSCAIYYRDADSGAEHIWGFGHLAMKATPPLDGKQTVVRQATLTGLGIGIDEGSFGFSLGWNQRDRIDVFDENTAVTIERSPSNDFFYFTIGTYPVDLKNPEQNQNTSENGDEYE